MHVNRTALGKSCRHRILLAAAAGSLAVLAAASCREATQVTLSVTTDVPCSDLRGTRIALGPPGAVNTLEPVSVTTACNDGRIGTLVIAPAGARDEKIGVTVASAVGVSPDTCAGPPWDARCIVARREVTFEAHTSLTLDIAMNQDCEGVSCDPASTCYRGACYGVAGFDPGACANGQCTRVDAGAGMAPADAAPNDAADVEAGADADAESDAAFDAGRDVANDAAPDAPNDAGEDAPDDGHSNDGAAYVPCGQTSCFTPESFCCSGTGMCQPASSTCVGIYEYCNDFSDCHGNYCCAEGSPILGTQCKPTCASRPFCDPDANQCPVGSVCAPSPRIAGFYECEPG
jgi:hypothetical protein